MAQMNFFPVTPSSIGTERVPAPGLLAGEYPQRADREGPGRSGWLELVGRWGRRRQERPQKFIAAVRLRQERCASEPQQETAQRLRTLRALLGRDGFTEDLLVETFALIVLACRRHLGMAPYDSQLIAARIMLRRELAEMATGEGKTLSAGIAAAAAALAGVPVHVVTANDYLVQRDAALMRPLYRGLGLTVGAVAQPMDHARRRAAYGCDIAYCTARELAFDYLRDGLQAGGSGRLLRGLCMAIIDEADAILLDEARVPLVLSRVRPQGAGDAYQQAWQLAEKMAPPRHFRIDRPTGNIVLEPAGVALLRGHDASGCGPLRHREHLVRMALTARHQLHCGRQYHVRDGVVVIIDETTGRNAQGRAWSDGLQQMVEIKEGCAVTPLTETLSQITYQRFFSRYLWLSGMSGTLTEARAELARVYGLQVCQVPLHRPSRRILGESRVFADAGAQWREVSRRAGALRAAGRAVLIGTDSVSDSEALSRQLTELGLPHAVLNARQDRHEAEIIGAAGRPGAITVATNMAGRGTDIGLAGKVAECGGLHVISCQQNAARRIDRQLIGRCARQGDPGSAEKFIALDGRLLSRSLLARLARRTRGRQAAMLGRLALRLAQQREERRQARERARLWTMDREMSGWLAFGGIKA